MVSKLGDGVGQIDAEIRPFRVIDDSCVVWTVNVCGVNLWEWEQFLEQRCKHLDLVFDAIVRNEKESSCVWLDHPLGGSVKYGSALVKELLGQQYASVLE